ncbi:MAG: 23S rRNA (guanosine(2251)-2'-O)-methyltransferase RlmB [Bdellovibrionaceae bacterium]|nr:23S rRNA (guanosine(2251)-2'-O)-methyltransferase RlmB [Pseudobdellovibrionaceae bacterium]
MKKPKLATSQNRVGLHACYECLLHRPKNVEKAYISRTKQDPLFVKIKKLLEKHNIPTEIVKKSFLDLMSFNHQGLGLKVNACLELDWKTLENAEESKKSMILCIDGVEDPHNLGALIRTAWLMGVKAIFVAEHQGLNALTPTVYKVACGGAEYVPVVFTTKLPFLIEKIKEKSYWVYGLSHRAKEDIYQCNYANNMAFVLGSESGGIRKSVENTCDVLLKIPQVSANASYNMSVAGALALSRGCL